MESVINAVVVYVALLVVFRLAGKRTLGNITTFDLVLLLIISETVTNALGDRDGSITHALLLVVTLIVMDLGLSFLKQRSATVDRLIEGLPLPLIQSGRALRQRMGMERVDESEIMAAAREKQGLERLDQIEHAVLERSGEISIIPRREE